MEWGRIGRSFHQYVGREVAERVYRDDRSLHGKRRTLAVAFIDLRYLTSLSGTLATDHVAQQLNEHFPIIVASAMQHRGVANDSSPTPSWRPRRRPWTT
jgi:class 3 adenylate cyclase